MDNKCRSLRRQISAYDFAIFELGLYLDTHPYDEAALCKRQHLQSCREKLIDTYEECCGPYIVNSNQVSGNRWTWIDCPWPWEIEGMS